MEECSIPAGIYLLNVNYKNTRKSHWRRRLLLTLNIFTTCSGVSIVNFEHVIAGLYE